MTRRWWLLVALVVVAYANSFHGPFIFDDGHGIVNNPSIRHLGTALTPPPASGMAGRPVVNLTFALNYAVGGLDVRGYHVVNLVIHILAGLVLFGIVRRTPGGETIAFPVALLWLLHPLVTESVVYVSQRTELLMSLFLLLTLYCAIRGWSLAAIVACGLGMGCKEVMVVAPLLVVLYDYVFGVDWRKRRGLYVGLAATWLMVPLLIGGVTVHAKMGEGLDYFTPWTYAKTQATVILHYLQLGIVPYPLVIDYDDWPRVDSLWPAVPVVVMVAISFWGAWQKKWWGFLGMWFFLILGPTSSFLPLATEVAAERRMYLPLIALVVPAVLLLRNKSFILAAGFGVLTFFRNADYRTAESIWRDTVKHRPGNARAIVNLATVVQPAEAIELYERALKLNPDSAEAHYNLAVILAGQNRLNDALPHFRHAAELSPRSSAAQFQFGLLLAKVGQLPAAIIALREAIRLEPRSASAHKELGVALVRQGLLREALAEFEEAVRIRPDDAEAQRYAALAQSQLKDGAASAH